MMRLLALMMALCGMAAGFVVSSPTSIVVVPQTVSSASMFFGKSSAQPKKAPAKAKGVVVPARSSAFKKGAKRPTASLNIVERGPAGLLEPLKEGKKFFSEENWLVQAVSLLRELPGK